MSANNRFFFILPNGTRVPREMFKKKSSNLMLYFISYIYYRRKVYLFISALILPPFSVPFLWIPTHISFLFSISGFMLPRLLHTKRHQCPSVHSSPNPLSLQCVDFRLKKYLFKKPVVFYLFYLFVLYSWALVVLPEPSTWWDTASRSCSLTDQTGIEAGQISQKRGWELSQIKCLT